ncbi:uncharacterized protein LOC134811993 [Bolinopsis microptera]|uniref:uncharacterized protein LOC134811993 n=1 Tax=Bolinopsis microptera TaxID=2820187 RepID=UPI0030795018
MAERRRSQVVLILCGSFNPLTFTHLRVLEMAKDQITAKSGVSVVGGLISPAHDEYSRQKDTLISAKHRIKMIRLTLSEQEDKWVQLWDWEVNQPGWRCTSEVLLESERACRQIYGAGVRVMLVCGIDMLKKMADPECWAPIDVEFIVKRYGLLVHMRRGYDVEEVLQEFPEHYRQYIHLVPSTVHCEVSSTEIRSLTARGLSTRYLLSNKVVTYINKNRLYQGHTSPRVVNPTLSFTPRAPGLMVAYTPPPRGGSTGDYEESDVE